MKPSITITVRPINNGYIVTTHVGPMHGIRRDSGETFYPTLDDVADTAYDSVVRSEKVMEELEAEAEEKKKKERK